MTDHQWQCRAVLAVILGAGGITGCLSRHAIGYLPIPICHDGLERGPIAVTVPRDTTLLPETLANTMRFRCRSKTTL